MQFVESVSRGETAMKRKYEHRPGFFGLASIAAGCAAKDGAVRSQENSTRGDRYTEMRPEPQPDPTKNKITDQSNRRGSGAGK